MGMVVWLEGEGAGEVIGLGWWWLGLGGRMDEGKSFGFFF